MRLVFIILLFPIFLLAQEGSLNQAILHYNLENYSEAVDWFNKYDKIEEDKDAILKRGIAYFKTNKLNLCIEDMQQAFNLKSKDINLFLYTAKAYHSQGKIDDAVIFYKNYLRLIDKENQEERKAILSLIKQCEHANNLKYRDQLGFVENLGNNLNSKYDEIKPYQSPNNINKYYFSSNRNISTGGRQNQKGMSDELKGKYYFDIFSVENKKGNWTTIDRLGSTINSRGNDEIQGFNRSGDVMFYSRGNSVEEPRLLTDTFSIDVEQSTKYEFDAPIIYGQGDKDIHSINDSTYIFSSKREGGYGGYDLYIVYKKDSLWDSPINLGNVINSEYDEVSPFLVRSGKKLYFSSNRLEGIGGYDLFVSNFSIDTWNNPTNLGLPINSSGDDTHINISADGNTAVFSSNRSEGYGGFDIYIVYFKEQIIDQMQYFEDKLLSEKIVNTESGLSQPELEIGTNNKIIEREFYNKPLYYQNDADILGPQNLSKLKLLIDILRIYPDYQMLISGHSTKEGLPEFDLYFTIKRVEQVSNYLIENGVGKDKIRMVGCGSYFPIAKANINGIENSISEKLNNRIDIKILPGKTSALTIINEEIPVADQFYDDQHINYSKNLNGLSYKIFITKASQMYKNEILSLGFGAFIEKSPNNEQYYYSIGTFNKYVDAKKALNKVPQLEYPDAKVIVYIDGFPINNSQIAEYRNNFPDLENFLLYELGR